MQQSKIAIGCFSEDFTGACEAASVFSASGLNTLLLNRLPEGNVLPEPVQAVVFPLNRYDNSSQTRPEKIHEALSFLQENDTGKIYYKYASDVRDFSSLAETVGLLLKECRQQYTLLCPAFPALGCTVENGWVLLESESPGADFRSAIQSKGENPGFVMPQDLLYGRMERRGDYLTEKTWKHPYFYVIPDHGDERDGAQIANEFSSLRLLTGSGGLAGSLANQIAGVNASPRVFSQPPDVGGRCLAIACSCTSIVREQVEAFVETGNPSYQIDPHLLGSGEQSADSLIALVRGSSPRPVLLYNSNMFNSRSYDFSLDDNQDNSLLLEQTMGKIAMRAIDLEISKIIVLGDTASQSVANQLDTPFFFVGRSLFPGISVMIPANHKSTRFLFVHGGCFESSFLSDVLRALQY